MNVNHQKEENVKQDTLTIEALRQFPGFEKLCDHEAQAIVESLAILAQVSYEIFARQQN